MLTLLYMYSRDLETIKIRGEAFTERGDAGNLPIHKKRQNCYTIVNRLFKGYIYLKKTAAFCLTLIIFMIFFIGSAFAAPPYDGSIESNAVMLIDSATGEVLFQKNADEQIRPASTTKIMTCILALEKSSMDEVVKIGPEGDWTGSGYSLLETKNGEEIKMKDLLYGFMLVSGNDAAAAIAVHIGGSEEGFAAMMNEKASELGMDNSHFVNAHGTDEDEHYVTARDMSKLALYAAKNEQFMDIVSTASYDMPETNKNIARTVYNTNMLLRNDEEAVDGAYYEYANGIKTGSTPKAFRCLVSSAKKEGTQLICLIYGDETKDGTERWPLAKSLFEYGFENYKTVSIQQIIDNMPPQSVQVQECASDDDGMLELKINNTGSGFITMDKSAAKEILQGGAGIESTIKFYNGDVLSVPIAIGEAVGTITYKSSTTGDIAFEAELIAGRDVLGQGQLSFDNGKNQAADGGQAGDTGAKTGIVGLAWLWITIAVLLLVIIIFLIVSLIKGRRR